MAPQDFGFFNHDLLIGNRLGGTIAAFDAVGGKFLGNLLDANEAPIAIDGLCGLEFDNRGTKETGMNPGSDRNKAKKFDDAELLLGHFFRIPNRPKG